jgi:hypothetical protein
VPFKSGCKISCRTQEKEENTMANVIKAKDLKPSGTGWLEIYWHPVENSDMELFEIAWAQWNSIEIDSKGRATMGLVKLDESYNKFDGWRIWDAKPTFEEREGARWDG